MTTKRHASDLTVIFDNGGGMTIQVDDGNARYQHTYDDASTLSNDIAQLLKGCPLYDFEGDQTEEYGWLEPSQDQISSGGYRVMTVDEVEAVDPDASGWLNVRALHHALTA